MHFIKKFIASYLYGKALMKFNQKHYKDAETLLKKVCKLDPNHDRKELYWNYLSRSYLALGKYNDALKLMSKTYELYLNRNTIIDDDFEQNEFMEFMNAFINVLNKVGKNDRARAVAHEVEGRLRKT